jgi:uncharacterized protein
MSRAYGSAGSRRCPYRLTMTDLELEAYECALEPKFLTLVPGNHFAPYDAQFE